ncbi:MAG: hypothetical protein PVSMB4_11160 [Ktedonobacterales bacterium]
MVLAWQHGFGANPQTYEALWLVGAGLIGLLVGNRNINEGKLTQPYDLIVGVVFAIAGIVGILGWFGVNLGGAGSIVSTIGLSLGGLYPLLHTYLGLKSFHHGLDKGK